MKYTAEEVRLDLYRNFKRWADPLDGRNHITRIERGVGWLHIDCANYGAPDTIHFFNP